MLEQLLYGSSGRSGSSAGGWGVLGMSDGLAEDERRILESGVNTSLVEVTVTPDLASQSEVDRRPRNLRYQFQQGHPAWWLSVPAGKDATGRPGNVFTHAVVGKEAIPQGRPVDMWYSPSWLAPFGSREVANVTVGDFEPGPNINQTSVVEKGLTNLDHVSSLVSATAHCYAGGATGQGMPLVLLSESCEEFIQAVRLITNLTAQSVSTFMPFSSYVRADTIAWTTPTFQILGVPMADGEQVLDQLRNESSAGQLLVMSLSEVPEEQEDYTWSWAGQVWDSGQHWQIAVQRLAECETPISSVLELMDSRFSALSPEILLSPEWPLALALAELEPNNGDSVDVIADWESRVPWEGYQTKNVGFVFGARTDPAASNPPAGGKGANTWLT